MAFAGRSKSLIPRLFDDDLDPAVACAAVGAAVVGDRAGLALAGGAALLLGAFLWVAVHFSGRQYDQQFPVDLGWPYWAAILGIWVDVLVVAAFALGIASLSTIRMLPLALGGIFAVAAKALGGVADYLAQGADGQASLVATYGPLLDIVRHVLPDLSRLDWRAWPMYGLPPDEGGMVLAVAMALAYIATMLGLALHAFSRREFS